MEVHVTNRMCGGGNHRNKRNKAEKQPTESPKIKGPVRGQQVHDEPKIIQSLISRENAEAAVIWHFEETEGSRKTVADLAEGSNSDMEKWIQIQMTGLDDEQKKTAANGITRAVQARRKDKGRESTAALEQSKKVCFIEEETEAQEARILQEEFMEERRAQEAHVEKLREQEKKGYEEEEDEQVYAVPNMEAGSSCHRPKRRS